jgi:hypothetical protein
MYSDETLLEALMGRLPAGGCVPRAEEQHSQKSGWVTTRLETERIDKVSEGPFPVVLPVVVVVPRLMMDPVFARCVATERRRAGSLNPSLNYSRRSLLAEKLDPFGALEEVERIRLRSLYEARRAGLREPIPICVAFGPVATQGTIRVMMKTPWDVAR